MVTTMTTTTTWTPTSHADYDRLKGMSVFSADGEKLGTIEAIFHPQPQGTGDIGGHYVLAKPGMLKNWFGGGSEFYVPEAAIGSVTDDGVRLAYPKDQIEAQGWNGEPAGLERFTRA